MPPVEVFVGLDALETSAEVVPGLPTRAELEQWIVEHDEIEKETEIFDTGELKKLRNFTRGLFRAHVAWHCFTYLLQLQHNETSPRRIPTSLN
jgi:hypothetical protein